MGEIERRNSVPPWVLKLDTEARAEMAKARISAIADQVYDLLTLQENNNIFVYSDTVANKIPHSFAARTYNFLTECLFRFQVARLCALWDNASRQDRISIPVVAALLQDRKVRRLIAEQHFRHLTRSEPRILNPSIDIEIFKEQVASAKRVQTARGQQYAKDAVRGMLQSIRTANQLSKSKEARELRKFRNYFIAHNLQRDAAIATPISPLLYGQEADFLKSTVRLIDALSIHATGVNYSWQETERFAKRCAEELWGSLEFKIEKTSFQAEQKE